MILAAGFMGLGLSSLVVHRLLCSGSGGGGGSGPAGIASAQHGGRHLAFSSLPSSAALMAQSAPKLPARDHPIEIVVSDAGVSDEHNAGVGVDAWAR